jgi:glycosyltransferase involved in cell wall biosynthesis
VDRVIREFQPDVLHGHYLGLALLLSRLSARHGVPFTIRTHSMDVLSEPAAKIEAICRAANSEWCRGVLTFPANRSRLAAGGLADDKLVDCWPVVNFERFYRPEPRVLTKRVMCAGPAIEKKAHDEFVDLGVMLRGSGRSFDLYADGPSIEQTRRYNTAKGSPIRVSYADPDDMASVYEQHDWLVYPSDQTINKVGFPVAIAEALASGIGVCWQELPDRRDEQLEFLGGAGYLFHSMEEVPAIITQPYPEEKRQAGFRAARRCDIERTKHLLSDAWPASVTRA